MAIDTRRSVSQRWDDYQPTKSTLMWGCAGSVAAALILGFTWGGWVTGASAREQAAMAANVARGELASQICVVRFNEQPDAAARLTELNAMSSSYDRRRFVEEGGWATMPGETSADRRGADGCVTALAA